MGPGPGPMGPGPSEELFVGYQQVRAGCRCRAEGLFASRDLGSLIISDLGPPVEFGSPSPFANLPFSFEPFPSRLNTSWFVGTADGINTAEVVMMVGGYDEFGARVGCTGLAILIYCGSLQRFRPDRPIRQVPDWQDGRLYCRGGRDFPRRRRGEGLQPGD